MTTIAVSPNKKLQKGYQDLSKLCRQAEHGIAKAQARLGAAYYNGFFTYKVGRLLWRKKYLIYLENNPTEAVRWLQMAAKQNHSGAIRMLGHCYRDGFGVDINWKEAASLYEKVRGVYMNEELGKLYEQGGYGLQRDIKRAYQYYKETDGEGFYIIQPHHVTESKVAKLKELILQEDPNYFGRRKSDSENDWYGGICAMVEASVSSNVCWNLGDSSFAFSSYQVLGR